MAKANAECTCKYCGQVFIKTVEGSNSSDAARKKKWVEENFDECSDCWNERRKKEQQERIEQAIASGLPELKGTEKQVKWASDLRDKWIAEMREELNDIHGYWDNQEWDDDREKELYRVALDVVEPHLDDFIQAKTSAKWWIDSRYNYTEAIIKEIETWVMTEMKTEAEQVVEQARAEKLTVRPQEQPHDGVVCIASEERTVIAEYAKSADFIGIMKKLGYRWDGNIWKKYLNDLDSTTDREAELGNILLSEGFAVQFSSEETKRKAVSGEFTDEVKRFVYLIDDEFKLYWEAGNHELYAAAISLRTAKWDYGKRRMAVKRSAYAELEDFCEIYGFVMSEKVQKAIAEERDKLARAEVVSVKHKKSEPECVDKLQAILESSREVISDLVDD